MSQEDLYLEEPEEPSAIGLAILLVVVLALMVIAFIWFVMQFDPLTTDFIEGDPPAATATEDTGGI
ncbi:MAG: hypothetical protein R3A46_19965 [Thermomicrobiales bacterium]